MVHVEDAEEQQVTRIAVRTWLSRPKDAAYDTEDSSFILESEVLGGDEDKEGYVKVIPIVGIGGIDKTILAQFAYNDERAAQHFDVKIRVFVSEKSDVKRIMKEMIESATKNRCEFIEMGLHKNICLIVLDVWNADWNKLRPLFRGGAMDLPTFPYNLRGLSGNDCWVFQREEENYTELVHIGRQIVRKCPEHLQTLLLRMEGGLQEFPRKLFSCFKYLVMLDLNSSGLAKLHESVGDLCCLKNLDLSNTFIRDLPETIQNLCSLETLSLRGCCNLEQLPYRLLSANLRHLIITIGCEANAILEHEDSNTI